MQDFFLSTCKLQGHPPPLLKTKKKSGKTHIDLSVLYLANITNVLLDQKSPVYQEARIPGGDERQTDITTYKPNRPMGRFSGIFLLVPIFIKLSKTTFVFW